MSKKRELYEISKESEAKIKKVKGLSDSLDKDWEEIVENCEKETLSAAKRGEYKYFFDATNHSMKTTDTIAATLKQNLGDVLIIVSPRGIEVNWESPE